MPASQAHSTPHTLEGPCLLLGSGGMLGRAWSSILSDRQIPFTALDYPEIDLAKSRWVDALQLTAQTTVINCTAYTDVDGAESHESTAYRINAEAIGELAIACTDARCKLVHYSTDYVFDGKANAPWPVDAPIHPINAYGRTKAEGDRRLLANNTTALLIRTSWLYAAWGKNFLRTIASALSEGRALKVVDDQHGRPTAACHLALASCALLEHHASGIFHVTGGGPATTWYGFACEIARHLDLKNQIEPCDTAAFPRPALRPAYSVLDLNQTESILGSMPDWRNTVATTLASIQACAPATCA